MLQRAIGLTAVSIPALLGLERAVLLPATTASAAAGDRLERRVADGESRTRTFALDREMEVTDFRLVFNGEEIDPSMFGGGDMDATTTDSIRLEMTDKVEKGTDDGRQAKFVRTYTTLEGRNELSGGMFEAMGEGGGETDLASDLEGLDVVFTLDRESGEYTAAFPEDSDADTELLEDLEGDLDFAALLPDREVAVDDEWELPLELFVELTEPGGDLKLTPPDDEGAEDVENPLENTDDEPTYDGTFKARLRGFREEDGVRYADVDLEFEISSELEVTDALDPMTQDSPMGEMTITPIEIRVERTAEGKGHFVWNVTRGCVRSVHIEADLTELNYNAVEIDLGGEVMEQSQEITSEGSMTCDLTVE
ncbi:MAG: hypothetical protein R3F34_12605 [Planctomycetota bacterium]